MNNSRYVALTKALSFWAIFQVLIIVVMNGFPSAPSSVMGILGGSILGGAMFLVTLLYLRFDALTREDLGLALGEHSLKRLLLSYLVGVIFFGGFFLVYLALTPVGFAWVEEPVWLEAVVFSLLTFLCLSAMEEVVFRGYLLRKLESAVGIRGAIYASSIVFGLYHGLSVESITGPAVWGLWYAVLLYWSKGLAIPIGFHAGVNFIQALFSQKEKWVPGLWNVDIVERASLLTVGQVTVVLQLLMFLSGVVLVEWYLRKVRSDGH